VFVSKTAKSIPELTNAARGEGRLRVGESDGCRGQTRAAEAHSIDSIHQPMERLFDLRTMFLYRSWRMLFSKQKHAY